MKSELKKQIRTLWILFSSRWGGPEQVAISDMVELVRSGITVNLLCLEGSPLHAAALRTSEIHLTTMKTINKKFDPELIQMVRSIIDSSESNIINFKDENLLLNIAIALRGYSEVSLVGSRYAPVESKFKRWYLAPLFSRLDYLTVLSETIRSSVLRNRPINDRKLKVINLGLDFSKFNPEKVDGRDVRAKWGADKDTVVIGSVGRFDPEIGQDTFLRAAAGLMKYQQERKMKFVIVGEDPLLASDEYFEELKELVKVFNIEEHVIFSSLEDNLPEVMAGFDIFVMPGVEEVPGLGALEALAMERPVVLSKVAGAEDIVGYEEFGLLVRPQDAYDLQRQILTLLENPSRRMTMGVNGRKYALKHYDRRIRYYRMLEVYEKCMKRRFARSIANEALEKPERS